MGVICDEKDKKEKVGSAWSMYEDETKPVKGLQQLPLKNGRRLFLITTATRMSAFTGESSIESIGASYQGSQGTH